MIASATAQRPLGRGATVGLVALAVALAIAAFPPVGLAPLALVMLAPLVVALEGRRPRQGFLIVYVYYIVMALGVVRWLVHPLVVEYEVPPAPAWGFVVLLVAAYSTPHAAAAAAYCALRPHLRTALAPLTFAALLCLSEWLRAEPARLPWLLAAHPLFAHPLALQTADLGGAYAVGFVVVSVNAGLGLALARRAAAPIALPALIALAATGYGAFRLARETTPGDPIRVGIVQASVPQSERFEEGSAQRNTRRHAELTRALAVSRPLDLVVWSETSVDIDLDASPALGRTLDELASAIRLPLVTGAPRSANGRRTNSVVLVTPDAGLVESYDKQVLVPFSEFDPPGASLFERWLGPVMAGEPYEPGLEATVLRRGPVPLAAPICFEITYPTLMRRFRDGGAELILNLSNDAWFGRTGYADMHFAHAVFRAIELRIFVVRAANTGISGVIDPAGRVMARLPAFEEGAFAVEVRAAGPPSFYARFGDAPVLLGLTALVIGSGLARLRAGR